MKIIEIKYVCDKCKKEVTDKKHLSIKMGKYAGWVEPPIWQHETEIEKRPYQFCGEQCLLDFLK